MKAINLKRIMEVSGLKTSQLSVQLFPEHKHPNRALLSVVNGVSNLDSDQVAKLSDILNVPIGLLYEDADWHMSPPTPHTGKFIYFKTYDYFAELDLTTMTTTVSRSGILYFEKIVHPKGILLTDYLSSLTDLIIKYK